MFIRGSHDPRDYFLHRAALYLRAVEFTCIHRHLLFVLVSTYYCFSRGPGTKKFAAGGGGARAAAPAAAAAAPAAGGKAAPAAAAKKEEPKEEEEAEYVF